MEEHYEAGASESKLLQTRRVHLPVCKERGRRDTEQHEGAHGRVHVEAVPGPAKHALKGLRTLPDCLCRGQHQAREGRQAPYTQQEQVHSLRVAAGLRRNDSRDLAKALCILCRLTRQQAMSVKTPLVPRCLGCTRAHTLTQQ